MRQSGVTTSVTPDTRSRHVGLALLALATGGFAIGTTEFVTMGLLPQIADGVDISIPTAGHVISAYAVGVVVGAPLIAALGARTGRKRLLLGLMAVFVLGNLLSAVAGNYELLMAARFLTGLPHGAFFGIGAVVGASLVAANRRAWAVSMIMVGLPIANIVGVPASTLLGQRFGWQMPFLLVGVLGTLTLVAVWFWVAPQPVGSEVNVRSELSALARPQVWMALLVGMVGFGGMFATYTFITPTMTELAGFSEGAVTIVLAVYGVGMTGGTLVGGRLADRALMPSLYGGLVAVTIVLGTFGWLAQSKPGALLGVFAMGFSASILIPALQTRLMDVAHEGQSLAASLNHSTLNVANALGAWLGSVVLSAGYGYEWPSRVGAVLAVAGLALAIVSGAMDRRPAKVAGAAS
ncbi:major facilitator superfamily MFS_1 [Kribbella flavida DSM 17836]|uniref:Major facilitator superfamily MFS_1 n=1 Tax=Kribbella flavida (strain DSM 17836 / JCM 10339 / NBRC 14399) TaxID=479435 RepID=D2PVN1_KRIFD|nr:major facilitator superfamily MFS_1 [Kribbella flavida DSM 17836]